MLPVVLCLLLAGPGCLKKQGTGVEAPKQPTQIVKLPGKAWAVVIGVERYEHLDPVRYAQADAAAVADALAGQGFTVTSLMDAQATKAAVLSQLETVLLKQGKADDRVVVFFAGRTDTRNETGGRQGYLLPSDAEFGDIVGSAIGLEQIRTLGESSPVRQVLIVVDAQLKGLEFPQDVASLQGQRGAAGGLAQVRARHIITAGSGEGPVAVLPERGRSVFGHLLEEGLAKAEADRDRDGAVTTSELFSFLESNTRVTTEVYGGLQVPRFGMLGSGEGEVIFLPSRPRAPLPDVLPDGPGSFAVREADARFEGSDETVRELQLLLGQYEAAGETNSELTRQLREAVKQRDALRGRYLQARLLAKHDVIGQDGARMVLVPAGEFTMGEGSAKYAVADPSYNYAPTHKVYLDAFYIDQYEVTTSLYAKFMEAMPRAEPRFWSEMSPARDKQRPVVGVAWEDARAYCEWAGKRLPTEAEWEKAARGTDGRLYPWGNENPKRTLSNYDWTGGARSWQGYGTTLAPVGSYEAGKSPYGVYDMAGNVWEWVSDWYGRSYYVKSPAKNPPGPPTGKERVVRGGSWRHPVELLRSSYRHHYQPTVLPFSYLGFRCAKDVTE